jgi:hypothetical protein
MVVKKSFELLRCGTQSDVYLQQNSKYSGHLKNLIVGIVGYSGSRVIRKDI